MLSSRRRSNSTSDADAETMDADPTFLQQIHNTEPNNETPDPAKQANKKPKIANKRKLLATPPGQTKISFAPAMTQNQFDLLFNKIDELKTELKDVVKNSDLDLKLDHKLKDLVTKDQLDSSVSSIKIHVNDENIKLKASIKNLEVENSELKERLTKVEKLCQDNIAHLNNVDYKATKALDATDDLEQHGRANSIRVYGMKDTDPKEDACRTIELIMPLFHKLGANISEADIDVAHRLGKYSKDSNRGIICKFVRRVDRHFIIGARKALVGSGISICDDLTNNRRILLNSTSRKENVSQVWTTRGNVIAKFEDGSIGRIENPAKTAISNYEKKNGIVMEPPKFLRKSKQHQGLNFN